MQVTNTRGITIMKTDTAIRYDTIRYDTVAIMIAVVGLVFKSLISFRIKMIIGIDYDVKTSQPVPRNK
jgi:hypothetical protein